MGASDREECTDHAVTSCSLDTRDGFVCDGATDFNTGASLRREEAC